MWAGFQVVEVCRFADAPALPAGLLSPCQQLAHAFHYEHAHAHISVVVTCLCGSCKAVVRAVVDLKRAWACVRLEENTYAWPGSCLSLPDQGCSER
eukprot:366467-Chlamydomonas_euryale.AAC.3